LKISSQCASHNFESSKQWQVLGAVSESILNLSLTIVLLTVKYTGWIAEKAVRAVF